MSINPKSRLINELFTYIIKSHGTGPRLYHAPHNARKGAQWVTHVYSMCTRCVLIASLCSCACTGSKGMFIMVCYVCVGVRLLAYVRACVYARVCVCGCVRSSYTFQRIRLNNYLPLLYAYDTSGTVILDRL